MKRFNLFLSKICVLSFFLITYSTIAQTSIRYQGYDGVGDNWNYNSNPGDGNIGITTNRFDTSPNSMRFSGSDEENSDPNVIFDNVVNLTAYTGVTLTVSFAADNVDTNDDLYMDISYDNGTSYTTTVKLIDGNSNKDVPFGTADVVANPYVFNVPGTQDQIRVRFRFDETSGNDNENDYYYIDTVHLEGTPANPEIEVRGNNIVINDNDLTPNTTDATDFGSLGVGNTLTHTFTIFNTDLGNLNLTGSPIIAISGSADFAVTAQPITTVVANGLSTTFEVTYTPSGTGSITADISIANNDSSENPYNFRIQGTGVPPMPEIDVQGLNTSIISGDVTPTTLDDTDFGNLVIGGTNTIEYTILNTGSGTLNLTGAPLVTITGSANFSVIAFPSATVSPLTGSTTFRINYTPSALITDTAIVSIINDDGTGGENPYTFTIQGTGVAFNPTPYCEDFSTTGHGWNLTVNGTGSRSWVHGTDGDLTGGTGNYIYTYQSSNRYSNSRDMVAESPSVNLSGYQNLTLNLDIYHRTESLYDYARVLYSIDGGTTWVLLGYADKSNGGAYVDSYAGGANWYNTGRFGSQVYGWTGNSGGWISVQYDLPSQGFDNLTDARFRVQLATDNIGTDVGVGVDNFCITGEPIDTTPTSVCGPGGISSDLQLWLKANDLTLANGANIATWPDAAFGTTWKEASSPIATEQPIFYDNSTDNVNDNPVVSFDGSDAMYGKKGYYNESLYIVFKPATTMKAVGGTDYLDLFCGNDFAYDPGNDDVEGIAINQSSARFDNELISYLQRDQNHYGKAVVSETYEYDLPILFNVRKKADGTGVDLFIDGVNLEILGSIQEFIYDGSGTPPITAIFKEIVNSRFWLGRSEIYSPAMQNCFDGDIMEVLSFSDRNTDAEKQQVESYLAIKYGLNLGFQAIPELGIPHIALSFYDSNGTILWDATDPTYTHNVSGIGRDDCSNLDQQQSKSVESGAIIKMGLGDIYDTNNLNIADGNSFTDDLDFLIWGSTEDALTPRVNPIQVNLGPSTVTTITDVTERTWKVIERATTDVGIVKISIPEASLSNLPPLTGNDEYVVMIGDDDNFDTSTLNLETIFLNPDGAGNLVANYDFDGTRYFVIGVAHEVVTPRHMGFDGIDNYTKVGDKVDIAGAFTASAWVRVTGSNSTNSERTVIAKADATTGYKLIVRTDNRVEFNIGNGAANRIRSSVALPDNVWHHVTVTYDGTESNLYIDGVLDTTNSSMNSPTANSADFTIGAVYESKTSILNHFAGDLDEIKIFNIELTASQIRYIMNQEIEESGTSINGTIVPNTITKNDIASMNWSSIIAYYSMNSYIGTHLNDVSGNGNRASLIVPDKFSIEIQTAPLPYQSTVDGDWSTDATWLNGSIQTIPGTTSIVDNTKTVDWNIVETNHDITMDNSSLPTTPKTIIGGITLNIDNYRSVLALNVIANKISLNGDTDTNLGNGLIVSHYLKLDGKIDLNGESQLIQSEDSDLDATSSGTLERDQQGTQDLYTYNYWSSPVGAINNSTNNNSYTVPQIFNDGTNPNIPLNINFITNSYDGTPSAPATPIGIADYWIWKYGNLAANYYNWEHLRSTGSLQAGEGFTMKGSADTNGNVLLNQNYVLEGKPNNGPITLTINAGSEYLVGNPYASAIDADQFITDNTSTTGTIYFWEHWGGDSHVTGQYQGGYATYNLSGAVPALQHDYSTGGNTGTGSANKLPGRHIPVAQGFFVSGASNGSIVFNNSQRLFQKEGSTSVFMRNSNNNPSTTNDDVDNRMKIRLGFNSVNTYQRQILVTVDDDATPQIDFGYDGETTEANQDDMYWMLDNRKFVIQGINTIDESTILPIGVHTVTNGINTFKIDELINVPNNLEIYIYDTVTETYHDIKNSPDFSIDLPAGAYTDRFELRFSSTLSTDDFIAEETGIQFYFTNNNENIVINNPKLQNIKSVELYNMLGQSILKFDDIETQEYVTLKTNNLSTGNYILNIKTDIGKISKKVLVE